MAQKKEESAVKKESTSSGRRIMALLGMFVILALFVGVISLVGRGDSNQELNTQSQVANSSNEEQAEAEASSNESSNNESPNQSAEDVATDNAQAETQAQADDEAEANNDDQNESEADDAEASSGRFLGSPDAPLLIKDFSDFRCPHCREAAYNLTPQIIEQYVNAGLVRLEFIPVVVTNEEGMMGGLAALCAEDQGQFWSYHDTLFEEQGETEFNLDNLTSFAEALDLDTQQFNDCMVSGKHTNQLMANNEQFFDSGGTGTPTFVVGDQLVTGGVEFEQVQQIIDQQLRN